jgi:hypothetical protein
MLATDTLNPSAAAPGHAPSIAEQHKFLDKVRRGHPLCVLGMFPLRLFQPASSFYVQ